MTDCVVSNKSCPIHPLYPSPPPLVVVLLVVIIVGLLGLVSVVHESVFCLPSSPCFLAVTTLLIVAIHRFSILRHCVSKCGAICLAAAAAATTTVTLLLSLIERQGTMVKLSVVSFLRHRHPYWRFRFLSEDAIATGYCVLYIF
jgi:hypothetical protein